MLLLAAAGTITWQFSKPGQKVKKDGDKAAVSTATTRKSSKKDSDKVDLFIPVTKKYEIPTSEPAIAPEGDIDTPSNPETTVQTNGKKICIDPGHQRRGNSALEPIAPGSNINKPKVTGGAVGVVTKVPEYELMMKIALKLKSELENKGYEVLLTRSSNDVDISNIERAKKASEWGADLYIRLHADSINDQNVKGLSTLYPANNSLTGSIYQASLKAAQIIHKKLIETTGRTDRGIKERSDLTGFNWSKVPTLLTEFGFMSNPEEDRILNTEEEQNKIVQAVATGIDSYFE